MASHCYERCSSSPVSSTRNENTAVLEDPQPVKTGLAGFFAKFAVLKGAPRELWLTFLIKFLIYTAYSITNKTMVLWLSEDLGFSDQAAGALVGWVWAPAMTVFTFSPARSPTRLVYAAHFFLASPSARWRALSWSSRPSLHRAGVRRLAAGCWRSAWHAGSAGRDAYLFDDGATLDRVLDHLRDHECRLFCRRLHF